ncbi:MAG: DUF4174 domain-containing protein [Hyphomicrobiaceae bacterium]|nr:DUF4174 domain-containing protein [Hyphomicrobiaceae bacterium]
MTGRLFAWILFSGWLVCSPVADAVAMSGYKWKYRPLVVFAGEAEASGLTRQEAIVASLRPAFIDRRIVVITVIGENVSADLGPPPTMSAAALRMRFGVAPGVFKVVLVGKDGGVKLASTRPIAGRTLFATIDAMPMRQDEVRRR